jgi:hydrogenase-4 component C
MMHLAMPMKQIVVISWFIAIFLPFGSATDMSALSLLLGLVFFILKFIVITFACGIAENVVCRVRFKLTGRQTWFILAVAVCAFAFCVLGI